MDGNISQWMQEVGSATKSPNNGTCTRSSSLAVTTDDQRKLVRPQKEQNCPRCHSTNTKFCYYNNYSLNQPRYFCKTCRRYWTQGGTLRSVPVGGGSRKNNKKLSSTSISSPTTPPSDKLINPHDLNLGLLQPPTIIPQFLDIMNSTTSSSASLPTLNFMSNNGRLNSFIPMTPQGVHNAESTNNVRFASSNFPFINQECKPNALAFTFDGVNVSRLHGNSNASQQEGLINGNSAVFPFGATKQHYSNTKEADDHQGKMANGYWINGMLGGGSW